MSAEPSRNPQRDWSYDGGHRLRIVCPELKEPVVLRQLSDTHLALVDPRDDEHADFYKRMAQWGADPKVFESTLPKAGDCDLLVLSGDNISFPTLANVEYLADRLRSCGTDYAYVAGNHDWHFEGDAGSDLEQRERWIRARLLPLYGNENPLMFVRRAKGLKVIFIDNSAYHITREQLDFWRKETADGSPCVLVMHTPFWMPGWPVTTCSVPDWGAATDPFWLIERRERWAETLSPETFEFRKAVFSTAGLIAVFAGHEHCFMASSENGVLQFAAPENRRGGYLDIRFESSSN